MARQHYENFPVASWALPRGMRPHVAAVYAFARYADDLADEGACDARDRVTGLEGWLDRLRAAVEAGVVTTTSRLEHETQDELVLRALAATIRECGLPVKLFEDLVSAFRQDVVVERYQRWDDLLDYCRRSANPVGRLVLRIAGHDDAKLDVASDYVCSALQLTNFLQDFDIDWGRGRLYVPAEVYAAHGATVNELSRPTLSAAWRAALADTAARTTDLFDAGRDICETVGGRLGIELRLTWLGGRRILEHLRRTSYDPRARRPTLGWSDALPIVWNTATWRYRS